MIVADDLQPDDMIHFLVETVAAEHPEATVEFKDISFVVESIHAALKWLLPPQRKQETRTERDGRRANAQVSAYSDLVHYIATTMRARGNENGSAVFIPQVNEVMDFLTNRLGIHQHDNDNEELINNVIRIYESVGRGEIEADAREAGGGEV